MMEPKEFFIPFSGLKLGKHKFEYDIENTFFESFGYQEFNGAQIKVLAILDKMNNMMELELSSTGKVNVDCDLTGEAFDQPIVSDLKLVIL